jgi:hypothetical protein
MTKSRRVPISEQQIDRRIEFLIREAEQLDAFKDQTVIYALRVITNYLAVGDDVSSSKLAQRSRLRSRAVVELAAAHPADWFANGKVRNEHQYPLKRAWDWLGDNRDNLSVSGVKEHLRRWPVVVVTREEDLRLKDDPEQNPADRYAAAGIEVMSLNDSGIWLPASRAQFSPDHA